VHSGVDEFIGQRPTITLVEIVIFRVERSRRLDRTWIAFFNAQGPAVKALVWRRVVRRIERRGQSLIRWFRLRHGPGLPRRC
jgi:hypothetical protein